MLLFSASRAHYPLVFKKLSACMEHVAIAAEWTEGEWGYIRNKGIEFRKTVMCDLRENIIVGIYGGKPVAMFALLNHQYDAAFPGKLPNALQLMYVYVDKDYRGLGFGRQIIEEAKRLAKGKCADLIVLDTLKPSLNAMYEKHGAKLICDGQLYSHPTEVFSMNI